MTRFVILAVPRTGSNLLCTLLNSHPEILCHHEIFNPQGVFTALTHRDEALEIGSQEERDRDPLGFLQRVWQTGLRHTCVGFKWTRGQNEEVLRQVLRDPQVKKIVLRRRNRVKTFVSERIARQTQQWEVYDRDELITPRPRISVRADDLRHHIAVNEQFYGDIEATLARTGQPFLDAVYETLFDPGEQMRFLEFLAVDDTWRPLQPASVKQNPVDLRETIANFDELELALSLGDSPENRELRAELDDRGV